MCLVLAVCLLLSACQLLPPEERYEKAPVISSYQKEQWEFVYVRRGDMVLSKIISCTYMPVQTQTLSFEKADARFDTMFVSVGERVQKGQLLAQLDITGIYEQIEDCTLQIRKLNMQIAAVEENCGLELERVKILLSEASQQELQAQLEQVQARFDLQKQPLTDELELLNMQLADCQAKLESRQIRAEIDGIVTYTRSIRQGDRVVAGDKMIVIEDSTSSTFCADSRFWQYFQPGQEHTIVIDDTQYIAVVVSESDLNIPETDKVEGAYGLTYFQLTEQVPYLEDGVRGTVTLELDCRESVLMVPEAAINYLKGKTVVYYEDENGIKAYKEVEVGLVADDMAEILSGVAEGERIILG